MFSEEEILKKRILSFRLIKWYHKSNYFSATKRCKTFTAMIRRWNGKIDRQVISMLREIAQHKKLYNENVERKTNTGAALCVIL